MAVNTHNKVAKNASAVKKNTASAGHALLRSRAFIVAQKSATTAAQISKALGE